MPSRFETRLAKLEKATAPPRPRRGDAELTAALTGVYFDLEAYGQSTDATAALLDNALVLVHGKEGAARFNEQLMKIYGHTAADPTPIP